MNSFFKNGPFIEHFTELMKPEPAPPEPEPETRVEQLRREINEIAVAKEKFLREWKEWREAQPWARTESK